MQKRIFVCGLNQESNSFNPVVTGIDKYATYYGKEMVNPKNNLQLQGALDAISEENFIPVYGTFFSTFPAGTLDASVVDTFLQATLKDLDSVGEFDGVAVVMHGATVSTTSDDVCGDILQVIRERVGDKPITVSFDLHANITDKIVKNADFICGFQRYPHLDIYNAGYRSVKVLAKHFNGEKVKTYKVALPIIASASNYTTESGALKDLMAKGHAYVKDGKIDDFSIFQVQPWLDTSELATTVIVIGSDSEVSTSIATELAKGEFDIKEVLQGERLLTIDEVIKKASANTTGKPIVICDSADSPNAGASGDSAYVIEKLLPVKDKFNIAVAVTDKNAVDKAFEVGVGATVDFVVGGTLAPKLTKPVLIKGATVKCLSDGVFYAYGPQNRGLEVNIGKTAVIQTGKMRILICYKGVFEGDRAFYRFVGIEPELMDIVDVKACTSFRAGYEPISAEICNAETLGAATSALKLLPFEKRPKPLYPFEDITWDMIAKPKNYR